MRVLMKRHGMARRHDAERLVEQSVRTKQDWVGVYCAALNLANHAARKAGMTNGEAFTHAEFMWREGGRTG
jgi:hypothetical protein